jgi:ABC-2 type transport system ATP-binding protein
LDYAIVATALGRRYGKTWAVKDLTLQIEKGEVFGLLGPNGAGKTSTMRMLACLVAPSEGGAAICGYDIVKDPTEVRRRVGILTDSAGLYERLSAQENLHFFGKLYDIEPREVRERAEYYLKMLGLWERRRDPAGTFSSGMKQKLSMARALLHDPAVLLLDEPTSALDPEGVKLVRDFITSLKGQGRTIVLCTHNLAEAQSLCDRVAIVKRTLLRVGTPKQLQRSLYGRQIEVRFANARRDRRGAPQSCVDDGTPTMNDLAVSVATLPGVGDVAVSVDSLLVSMDEPEHVTPGLVRFLVGQGMEIIRVAEVEHTLERAYLDLVARQDEISLNGHVLHPEEVRA